MSAEEKIRQLAESLGILSETLFLFYKNLEKVGFTETQALTLTDGFMSCIMAGIGNRQDEE